MDTIAVVANFLNESESRREWRMNVHSASVPQIFAKSSVRG